MCVITFSAKIELSEEDIPVWKVLRQSGARLYSLRDPNFEYHLYEDNEEELKLETTACGGYVDNVFKVTSGLHAYTVEESARARVETMCRVREDYKNNKLYWTDEFVVRRMVIPKDYAIIRDWGQDQNYLLRFRPEFRNQIATTCLRFARSS